MSLPLQYAIFFPSLKTLAHLFHAVVFRHAASDHFTLTLLICLLLVYVEI